jgi:hypothetical protein
MNNLLGHFKSKVGKENIFKPTTGNESLHKISNDNGVTVETLLHPNICQKYSVSTL